MRKKSGKMLGTSVWRRSVGALLLVLATPAAPQELATPALLQPGEVLTYRAVSGRFGTFGTGIMRVAGPVEVRGEPALELAFDFRGRVGIFRLSDRTRSWVAADRFATLRYQRTERSPLGSRGEEVEVYPEEGRWTDASGLEGETACGHPLDELSFLYFLRTLPLTEETEYTLTHHFDPARNPVTLKVLGRETTKVPAGSFPTVVVEMRVADERLGAMKIYLSDDEARIPVRIESSAPWVGSTRLLLEHVAFARQ